VDEEAARRLSRHLLRRGDILFARRGVQATGNSALITDRHVGALCGTGAILLRVHDHSRVDPSYLSFVLSSEITTAWLKQHAVGAVMPNLNEGVLRAIPLSLPDIDEQRAIARSLTAFDDKIDLNRRTNDTLEGIARTLFKSWFVDFDPVRAKADRRPVSLDSSTADLFPSSFEHTNFGLRPKGWAVHPLDGVARFLNGLALQKFPATGPGYLPVIKIAELRSMTTKGSDRASRDIPDEYIIRDGDLLFSWSGSLEVVVWCGGEGALNQHLFKVTSPYSQWFIHGWLLQHLPEFRAIAADKATTMGHIQRKHLTEAAVLVPAESLLRQLDQYMAPLQGRSLSLRLESRTLAELRDTLLPKLLSGEVRIRDAERSVAAAV
jgi:type I restriction enzyme S subunit